MKRIMMLLIIFICILLIGCKNSSNDLDKINESINNLQNISDDENRLIEIMKIDRQIESLSLETKEDVNMDKLSYEKESTIESLKRSFKSEGYVESNNDYCTVNDIHDIDDISYINVFVSDHIDRIDDTLFNKTLLSLLDIPYMDEDDLEKSNITSVDVLRSKETDILDTESYCFELLLKESSFIGFMVYPSGYVRTQFIGNKQGENINKTYMSLVRIDCNKISNLCKKNNIEKYQKYEKYDYDMELFTDKFLEEHTFTYIAIVENVVSSIVRIINDEDQIKTVISYLKCNQAFGKEYYYNYDHYYGCMTITIVCESLNGEAVVKNFLVSKEGIIYMFGESDNNGRKVVYYSGKGVVDYDSLLRYIKSLQIK